MIQNDTILYEKYFEGASRDTIVTSMSVAKSWNSALIGAAIDDGYIQSVDDPITDYLPDGSAMVVYGKRIGGISQGQQA